MTKLHHRACRTALPLLLLAGCAATDGFPSLAPRPIETLARQPEREVVAPARAADPALEEKIAALDTRLRAADDAWQGALAPTRAAARQAAGSGIGEERWIVAQQAVSALETMLEATTDPLEEVDRLRVEQAESTKPADTTRLDALWTRGVAQAQTQKADYTALAESLPNG